MDIPEPDSVENGHIPVSPTIAIIAGSRSVTDMLTEDMVMRLLAKAVNHSDFVPDVVVSGTASGADMAGERWATSAGLPVAQFPAPWDETDHPDAVVKEGSYGLYDARAGFRRNQQMAEFAAWAGDRGVLLALQVFDAMGEPSSGTADMIERGRDVLGDDNVFVVPLGEHPPVHVLEKATRPYYSFLRAEETSSNNLRRGTVVHFSGSSLDHESCV
jgi:hypothetical protein